MLQLLWTAGDCFQIRTPGYGTTPKLFEPRRQLYRSDVLVAIEQRIVKFSDCVGVAFVGDCFGDNDGSGGSGSFCQIRCATQDSSMATANMPNVSRVLFIYIFYLEVSIVLYCIVWFGLVCFILVWFILVWSLYKLDVVH